MERKKPNYTLWIGIILVSFILAKIIISIYESYFYKFIQYGYACPNLQVTSKCYKVPIDIESGECDEDGGCTDPILDGFQIGSGYITCEDSEMIDKKNFLCTDDRQNNWKIELSDLVKVKK